MTAATTSNTTAKGSTGAILGICERVPMPPIVNGHRYVDGTVLFSLPKNRGKS